MSFEHPHIVPTSIVFILLGGMCSWASYNDGYRRAGIDWRKAAVDHKAGKWLVSKYGEPVFFWNDELKKETADGTNPQEAK